MRSGACPKCKSRRIGHLARRVTKDLHKMVPMFVGVDDATFSDMGVLEAYVCGECGLLETYVKSPERVPFDALNGFRWLNEPVEERGPFR